MARGFRSTRGSLQAPKRQIGNENIGGNGVLTFGASPLATAAGSVGLQLVAPAATLVRSRGRFGVAVTVSGANTNLITGVFGMIIVSAEAFAAGLASLSTPLDDSDRAWVVWQSWSVYADGGALGESAGGAVFREYEVDSRGMRKMKAGDTLAFTVEANQDTSTTGTLVSFSYQLRFQFKL